MAERDDERLPPAPPSRGRDKELWVGVFVIVGILSTLAVLFTMTDAALFRGRYIVTTMVDNAGGIRKGDPVRMLGVVIGRVQRFKIEAPKVAIRLEIEGEYDIPSDSRVELKSKSALGEMMADVLPGTSTQMIKEGDTLPGTMAAGMFDNAAGIAEKADDVLSRVKAVLPPQTVKNIEESVGEARSLLKELNGMAGEQRKELAVLSKSLRRSAEGIEKASTAPELEAAVKRTDAITKRMDEVSLSLGRSSQSLETVLDRIEKGEGTLGRLVKDDALYKNVNDAVVNVGRLAEDVRNHPKRYIKLSLF